MSIFDVQLTPADLPQAPGASQASAGGSSGTLYENYRSHHGAGSYVPASPVGEQHSPVLGGEGPG